MNVESTKTFWMKLVERPYRFFLWTGLFSLVLLAVVVATILSSSPLSANVIAPPVHRVLGFALAGFTGAFAASVFGFVLSLIPPLMPLFRRVVRHSVFLLACVVTVVVAFYTIERWRGKRAWEEFKRTAEAAGEPFDLRDIIPAPVPNERNAAAAPLFMAIWDEFDPKVPRPGEPGATSHRLSFSIHHEGSGQPRQASANWMVGRRTNLKAWQEYFRNPPPAPTDDAFRVPGMLPPELPAGTTVSGQATNEFPITPVPQSPAEDVLFALSRHDPQLNQLRAACERPYSRFPVRYDEAFTALLPHLAPLKEISQFLALRVAAELEAGRIDEAAADVDLAFRVAELVRNEPSLISQLVRIAQTQINIAALWEGCAANRWTDAQLARFEQRLGELDFLADYHRALSGERMSSISFIDNLRRFRDPGVFDMGVMSDGIDNTERLFGSIVLGWMPGGWFDQNKVNVGRIHLDLIVPAVNRTAVQISPSKVNDLAASMQAQFKERSPYNWLSGFLLPAVSQASARFAQTQSAVNLARVACALERHRLAHGAYPETLDALAPRFLAKLPHDVIDGQPLRYVRSGDGSFILYSIGWNERDDGGTVALVKDRDTADWKQGDWVWRYPAE